MEAQRGDCMTLGKGSTDYVGDLKMLEMPEPGDTCQGEPLTGSGTSPGGRSVLQSDKLGGKGHRSLLTLEVSLQESELALLVFCLALGQHFLICPLPSLLEC